MKEYTFFILVSVVLILGITGLVVTKDLRSTTKIVDCYDGYQNKIMGLNCKESVDPLEISIIIGFFVFVFTIFMAVYH